MSNESYQLTAGIGFLQMRAAALSAAKDPLLAQTQAGIRKAVASVIPRTASVGIVQIQPTTQAARRSLFLLRSLPSRLEGRKQNKDGTGCSLRRLGLNNHTASAVGGIPAVFTVSQLVGCSNPKLGAVLPCFEFLS
jgi:hypothetical protein